MTFEKNECLLDLLINWNPLFSKQRDTGGKPRNVNVILFKATSVTRRGCFQT